MKERQRWQPEEDALLRAYVKQYGPKEWHLVSHRMNKPLDRDAKSCLERWKNYLKPGIKKGSLTQEEQALVISLQAKYGNKWKKIASEVPGRTAKRLGKWWEVFKEKQLKQQQSKRHSAVPAPPPPPLPNSPSSIPIVVAAAADQSSTTTTVQSKYDHILETFAEKYVQPKLKMLIPTNLAPPATPPTLCLGTTGTKSKISIDPNPIPMPSSSSLPPWLSSASSSTTTSTSCSSSPSVSLSLSPSDPGLDSVQPAAAAQQQQEMVLGRFFPVGTQLVQYCKELEEVRMNWVQHKKEATWRLSRLEQQLESEKARKRREKMEEVEAKIRGLREEERVYMERIESECREQLSAIQRDADAKETKMAEAWAAKHVRLAKLVEQMGLQHQQQHLHFKELR
ncbi:hypothetical protein ACLOJK_001231 [Asimina triloba]